MVISVKACLKAVEQKEEISLEKLDITEKSNSGLKSIQQTSNKHIESMRDSAASISELVLLKIIYKTDQPLSK